MVLSPAAMTNVLTALAVLAALAIWAFGRLCAVPQPKSLLALPSPPTFGLLGWILGHTPQVHALGHTAQVHAPWHDS